MTISEKVSYLKGLAEGLKLDENEKEGKLLSVIIDILDDMALEMEDIQDEQCDLEEGLDAVSDDLSDVESFVYEAFSDDEDEEEDEDEDEQEECYATTCPNCQEEIFFDESVLEEGSVECPNCGETLEFDLDSCEGCPGCDETEE